MRSPQGESRRHQSWRQKRCRHCPATRYLARVYQQQGQQQQAGGGPQQQAGGEYNANYEPQDKQSSDDNVVDADYEVVDDDKDKEQLK